MCNTRAKSVRLRKWMRRKTLCSVFVVHLSVHRGATQGSRKLCYLPIHLWDKRRLNGDVRLGCVRGDMVVDRSTTDIGRRCRLRTGRQIRQNVSFLLEGKSVDGHVRRERVLGAKVGRKTEVVCFWCVFVVMFQENINACVTIKFIAITFKFG